MISHRLSRSRSGIVDQGPVCRARGRTRRTSARHFPRVGHRPAVHGCTPAYRLHPPFARPQRSKKLLYRRASLRSRHCWQAAFWRRRGRLPSCQNSRPVPAIAVTPLRRADPSQAIERHKEATTRFTVPAYRKFESISLQRRVRCEPISSAGGAERQAAFGINELLTRYSEAERTAPNPRARFAGLSP
jgi:hypothetical protein